VISPDGARLLICNAVRISAQMWDIGKDMLISNCDGHTSTINSAVISASGTRIVTASMDASARVWDAATGALLQTFTGHPRIVYDAAISPDGEVVATTGADTLMKLWRVASAEVITSVRFPGRVGINTYGTTVTLHAFKAMAFTSDGKLIQTVSESGILRRYDAVTGACRDTVNTGDDVQCAAYSADGQRLAIGTWNRGVKVRNARTGALIAQIDDPTNPVLSITISSDGRRVAGAELGDMVLVWEVEGTGP